MALLRSEGWVCYRSAGSHSPADVVALRGGTARLVQVKSDVRGPFCHFRPTERRQLLQEAQVAGAEAWLLWWPPYSAPEWIPPPRWPATV